MTLIIKDHIKKAIEPNNCNYKSQLSASSRLTLSMYEKKSVAEVFSFSNPILNSVHVIYTLLSKNSRILYG